MEENNKKSNLDRRKFFKTATAAGMGAAFIPLMGSNVLGGEKSQTDKPKTNVQDALKHPRNKKSMPGMYPAKVVEVFHENSVKDNKPVQKAADEMVEKGMKTLTGDANSIDSWKKFFSEKDIIGIKVNPIGGKLLSTSHEVVKAVIKQLENAGISRNNIIIYDRREFQLHEAGFTKENYPGIKIQGVEIKDSEGSFYDKEGKMYSEKLIDKDWYYWADVDGKYDAYTLPMMVNDGKYSYFHKFVTKEVDKIINIPIMKNAGGSVTLGLKNLGYGVITNTSRLHEKLWADTCAEVCAFPPVRDKVVLTIIDGLKGCFDGGPGANPQFFCDYNTMIFGTDPVAVDRVGYEVVLNKRIKEGKAKQDNPKGREFLEMAAKLKLGEADLSKIKLKKINLT